MKNKFQANSDLSIMHHKGCGKSDRPLKSSTRFRSTWEVYAKKKLSNDSRKCGQFGKVEHNKRSCNSRAIAIVNCNHMDCSGNQVYCITFFFIWMLVSIYLDFCIVMKEFTKWWSGMGLNYMKESDYFCVWLCVAYFIK